MTSWRDGRLRKSGQSARQEEAVARAVGSATARKPQGSWPGPLRGPGRRVAWRRARLRRWIAAVLVGVAAWLSLNAFLPQPAVAGVPVIVAARSLPAGHVLNADDLTTARWPADLRPSRTVPAIDGAVGQTLASALETGEAVTTSRLRGPGLLANAPARHVAAHIGLRDPAMAAMVGPGDHVDLIGTAAGAVLASDVVVLAVDAPGGGGTPGGGLGGVWTGTGRDAGPSGVVVAVSSEDARKLASASAGDMTGSGVYLTLRLP